MKIKIELTPYNALSILAFLRQFVNDGNKVEPNFKAIHDAVDQFGAQIVRNITYEQIKDYNAENQVNQLIGKSPQSSK